MNRYTLILSLFFQFVLVNPLSASTECVTGNLRLNDWCKTQLAFKLTIASGGEYGEFSTIFWGGIPKLHSNYKEKCSFYFNNKNYVGTYKKINWTKTETDRFLRKQGHTRPYVYFS